MAQKQNIEPTKTANRSLRDPAFSMRPNSNGQRTYAERMINVQSKYAHARVIVRAKALIGVVVLALLFAAQVLLSILHHGAINVLTGSLAGFNAGIQLAAAAYFILARDQHTAASLLKLLMIITGIQLFIGFSVYGSLVLTLLSLAMQYYAYTQVSSLKDMF